MPEEAKTLTRERTTPPASADGGTTATGDALLAAIGRTPVELEKLEVPGHDLMMRPPSGSNYIKAMELAGSNAMLVPTFEAMFCIAYIDGDPVSPPVSRAKMDDLCDRLGRQSIDDIISWYQRKAYPELLEVQAEHPDIPVDSPMFRQLVEEKRRAKIKK